MGRKKRRLVGITEYRIEVEAVEQPKREGKKELTQGAIEKTQYMVSESGKPTSPWMVEN